MIHDHFRATGASDAAQDLSDLFNVSLYGNDIQDFDTRWDQALLAANVLGGLYKLETRDSLQLQTVLAMYDQELIEIEHCQAIKD